MCHALAHSHRRQVSNTRNERTICRYAIVHWICRRLKHAKMIRMRAIERRETANRESVRNSACFFFAFEIIYDEKWHLQNVCKFQYDFLSAFALLKLSNDAYEKDQSINHITPAVNRFLHEKKNCFGVSVEWIFIEATDVKWMRNFISFDRIDSLFLIVKTHSRREKWNHVKMKISKDPILFRLSLIAVVELFEVRQLTHRYKTHQFKNEKLFERRCHVELNREAYESQKVTLSVSIYLNISNVIFI